MKAGYLYPADVSLLALLTWPLEAGQPYSAKVGFPSISVSEQRVFYWMVSSKNEATTSYQTIPPVFL